MKLLTAGTPDPWHDGPTVKVYQEWRKTSHGPEYRIWFEGQARPEWGPLQGEYPVVMRYPADPIMLTNLPLGEIE